MYERRAVSRRRFEAMVRRALAHLPEPFASRLENVDVIVRTRPTEAQLRQAGLPPGHTLLGLYVGLDLTRRGDYSFALPDRIFIFQQPLERISSGDADLEARVRHTVLHELAHHFGISDARLHEIGRY